MKPDELFELSCRLDEAEEMLLVVPNRVPELLENMPPPMFMDLNGIGTSSWGRDLSVVLFESKLLKSDIPIDVLPLLIGIDDMRRSGIWFCKFDPALFTLMFSSATALQNALWVMKLSLLQQWGQIRVIIRFKSC